jgi:hypothetical protein
MSTNREIRGANDGWQADPGVSLGKPLRAGLAQSCVQSCIRIKALMSAADSSNRGSRRLRIWSGGMR